MTPEEEIDSSAWTTIWDNIERVADGQEPVNIVSK